MSNDDDEKPAQGIWADRKAAHLSGNYVLSPVLDRLFNSQAHIAPEIGHIISGWRTEQKRLNSIIQPLEINPAIINILAEIGRHVTIASLGFEAIATPLHKAISSLDFPLKKFTEELGTILKATAPFMEGMVKAKRWGDFLQTSGWLPHNTFPFDLIDDFVEDIAGFNKAVLTHYEIEWENVKETLIKNIHACQLDAETKEVFVEAIKSHEMALYRSVPRLLFPEIERVSRIDHHDNKMERIASVPKLREAAGELTSDAVTFQPYFSLEFFGRLVEHVYVKVDENNLDKFVDDPVPNRHAALHGHVTYNSIQSSLNMLFMADYIFQVIAALRKADEEVLNKLSVLKSA